MRPTLSLHGFAQHIFNRIDDKDFIDPVFCQTVDTLAPYSWQPQGPLSHNQYGPISQGMRPSSPTTPEYVHAFVPGENCRSPPNSGTPAPTCMPNSAEFVPAFDSHTPSRPTPPWTYAATHGTPNTTHIRPAIDLNQHQQASRTRLVAPAQARRHTSRATPFRIPTAANATSPLGVIQALGVLTAT
jgi:hypothetical protein